MTVLSRCGNHGRTRRANSPRSRRNKSFWTEGPQSRGLEARTLLSLTATTFPIPLVGLVQPDGITTGSDGNLWFTETGADRIGRMTPAGVLTEFPLPAVTISPGSTSPRPGPTEITSGPDGALWFTGIPGELGRITTAGVVTEFAVSAGTSSTPVTLSGITAGPDGAVWFTGIPGEIGRITTSGVVTEFAVPDIPPPAGSAAGIPGPPATLAAITVGPDSALWFTGVPGEVGRITTAGVVTEFKVPDIYGSVQVLGAITTGPDGALWFAGAPGQVGRITTAGVVTGFALPSDSSGDAPTPAKISPGPDGALWFTGVPGKVSRITTAGVVTEFAVPGNAATIADLTSGPDGKLWLTEQEDGVTAGEQPAVGEITSSGVTKLNALPQGTTLNPNMGVPANPTVITAGPDGALWFGENGGIGRIATDGTFEQFAVNMRGETITGITSGPDGAIWFALSNRVGLPGPNSAIGRITTSGTITEYRLPARVQIVGGITAGPDHSIWFTENLWNPKTEISNTKVAIGRITQNGHIKTFAVHLGKTPTKGGGPSLGDIMPGPDGKLWFMGGSGGIDGCLCSGNQVPLLGIFGQVTARGSIHVSEWVEAHVGQGAYPADGAFVPGPDGKLWYANEGGRAGVLTGSGIIRVSTSGAVSPAIPDNNISPSLVRLPNGQVWFESGSSALGTATRSGIIVIRDLPGQKFSMSYDTYAGGGMAAGPDGNLWLTTPDSSIERISGLDTVSGSLDYRHRAMKSPDYRAGYDTDQWTNVSSSAHPTFAGVAKPGAEVTLWAQQQGANQPVAIGQVKASSRDGSWTLKSHKKLSDGNYAVTASETGDTEPAIALYSLAPDASGNLSSALVIQTTRDGVRRRVTN
jgi:streptogramin lyase